MVTGWPEDHGFAFQAKAMVKSIASRAGWKTEKNRAGQTFLPGLDWTGMDKMLKSYHVLYDEVMKYVDKTIHYCIKRAGGLTNSKFRYNLWLIHLGNQVLK